MVSAAPDNFCFEESATPLQRLRQKLCGMEASPAFPGQCDPPVAFGIATIDDALGGGLACGALHEIAAMRETHLPAATGFALALAIRTAKKGERPPSRALSRQRGTGVLWIAEDLSLAENGVPYGPGLDETGISPERLITIAAARMSRCAVDDGGGAAMPRHRRGDRRDSRARHRSGGDATSLACGRSRRHARTAVAHHA